MIEEPSDEQLAEQNRMMEAARTRLRLKAQRENKKRRAIPPGTKLASWPFGKKKI